MLDTVQYILGLLSGSLVGFTLGLVGGGVTALLKSEGAVFVIESAAKSFSNTR